MSRFFPHVAYAEDQPYARSILISHVIHRGAQAGAVLGVLSGTARALVALRRAPGTPLLPALIRGTGYGTLVGAVALGAVGVTARMWGREEIEWKDRSWRLMENRYQVECDDWSMAGTAAGAVTALAREGGRSSNGRLIRITGVIGLGNLVGVAGYMVWRHAVHGGKFDDS